MTLEARDVCKSYDGKPALWPTSLEFDDRRTTAILGQSGCGKSTLIRMLMGLVWPDSGHVRVDGVKLERRDVLPMRRKMGYVIQEGGLFPHLTARENILLLPRFLGQEAAAERYMDDLIDLTRLPGDVLDRYPTQVSGGQRQRLSLMRALILKPQYLLLDEPLGALDPMIRADLQNDLKEIFKVLGRTVILVTHDLAEAAFLADEIVMMRSGRIVQAGTYAALVNQPSDAYVTRFINSQRLMPMDARNNEVGV